ncbi:MAG: GGDEF domain-containing protein [Deltaproteobacteria bacterium]|nr:GGDEF domain-containing protein [Deltaproteobacteria bacterium]MBW1873828.1 GGDEF domain-containing protein [Deltaproteobacteria bacterium]MBW2211843.1 GGDEF domain-containing protein [Deltaproteobacteria bacterium]MBW2214712.1 GGDEF domain-containing protein [Deltaproteobacteria bacterium]MBW2379641.1 GGDEF domain-containing protein [Deltaproteobacteria bacterium]
MYDSEDLLGDDPRHEFERILVTRCRAGGTFALMLIDLDGFAAVRARFEAHVADLLLYEVASRLREKLDEHDVVMRSGSSEFAVFIRGMKHVQNAERLANELVERVQRPIMISGTRFCLSASIGITLSPRQSGEWRLLLQDADAAAYDAKTQGRGHVSIIP